MKMGFGFKIEILVVTIWQCHSPSESEGEDVSHDPTGAAQRSRDEAPTGCFIHPSLVILSVCVSLSNFPKRSRPLAPCL